jgi:flagellar protein FliO/FliZ
MTMNSTMLALFALMAVIALVLLAQRAARWGGLAVPRAGGRLAVVEAVTLDGRRRLSLVRCDQRHLLVLTGGAPDLVVGWLEAAPPDQGAC